MAAKGTHIITDNPVSEFFGTDGKLTGVTLKNGTRQTWVHGRQASRDEDGGRQIDRQVVHR
jgi:hypothetical protein